jgi:hypothetical protein
MGKDVSDVVGTALAGAAQQAIHGTSTKAGERPNGSMAGERGLATGRSLGSNSVSIRTRSGSRS